MQTPLYAKLKELYSKLKERCGRRKRGGEGGRRLSKRKEGKDEEDKVRRSPWYRE